MQRPESLNAQITKPPAMEGQLPWHFIAAMQYLAYKGSSYPQEMQCQLDMQDWQVKEAGFADIAQEY